MMVMNCNKIKETMVFTAPFKCTCFLRNKE